MKALVVDGDDVETRFVHHPDVAENEVCVRVAAIGLCRTDLRVMDGSIVTDRPRIPGHEFSGIVHQVGDHVTEIAKGDRVTVNPVLPCNRCEWCEAGHWQVCQQATFLGVDTDGACAEFICVPANSVSSIPQSLSFEEAAFAEPVCASLAVLKSGIQQNQRGVIYGDNRIAELTRRILASNGFFDIEIVAESERTSDSRSLQNQFDFAIETEASLAVMSFLVSVVRPNGRLILKSRQQIPVAFNFTELLSKELSLHAVNYGSFREAVDLLGSGAVRVDDLVGPSYGLEDFAEAIQAAEADEHKKIFLIPQPTCKDEPRCRPNAS